ncbi:14197_t:CDS:10 [Funneliformis caledonium]|uniref:14197_t:CDS:1 n=1 Tax=Funneliformis caledonium TaxID=1117310 RepID=A0A9N9FW25_9GLOM|nr:14197_t:CDS:10 [Funneliformis caledonium]
MVQTRSKRSKQEVFEEIMPLPQYAEDYFNRVDPFEWKLSHFLRYTEKSRSNSLSRDQILRAFKTGLKDVVEKMSGNGNRPIVLDPESRSPATYAETDVCSRVGGPSHQLSKTRKHASVAIATWYFCWQESRESDEIETYWQTVRAKTAINIAKSHHKLQKVSQITVNLLCGEELPRKRVRLDDEVFSSSDDHEDYEGDDIINSQTVYKAEEQEAENSSGNESENGDDYQNDEASKDCLRKVPMDNEDDELEVHAKETIRNDGEKWIICGTDVRDALSKWKKKPDRALTFYDIVDVTPGSNSDFIRSLPKDVVHEIRQSKLLPAPVIDNADGMKQYIIDFIKTKKFREYVDESYVKTRKNNVIKFIWDYLNLLVESFERDNDLADYNLSELGYREIFLTPLMRSLFRGKHREMSIFFGEKCLFASLEDRNREKTDEEDRNAGRKIDIIWSMKPTDFEFSICEVSGPPNQHNHTHFFNDKLKIAKMLKVILNRIVIKYGGAGMNLSSLKLYGLHVYYNEIMVYEMSIPFRGLYVFCEVLRSKLPTNDVEVGLMSRSVPVLLEFKKLLERSLTGLKDYIQDACTRTPDDNGNADLFITSTDLTPTTNRKQPNGRVAKKKRNNDPRDY